MIAILNDAQTSGGLLIAADSSKAAAMVEEMHAKGATAARIIGEVIEGPAGTVEVDA